MAENKLSAGFPNLLRIRRMSDLKCPDCQVQMAPFSCENIVIDKCLKCGGIWFDSRELGIFIESLRSFDLSKIEILFRPPERDAYHVSVCPRDEDTLTEGYHSYGSKVRVHRCNRCKGVWLPEAEAVNLIEMAKVSQAIEPEMKKLAESLVEYEKDNQRWRDLKTTGDELSQDVRWRGYFGLPFGWTYFGVILPLWDDNPRENTPILTGSLIVINVLIFIAMSLNAHGLPALYDLFALKPAEVWGGSQFWTVFTSMFLHGGVLHLLGNMYFLWMFGDNIEDRLGPKNFALFYVLLGLIGNIAYMLSKPESYVPALGASGAVAGLMGAYLIYYPRVSVKTYFGSVIIDVPAWLYMIFWFVMQLVLASSYSMIGNSGVAWGAHIGGFLGGMALAYALKDRSE